MLYTVCLINLKMHIDPTRNLVSWYLSLVSVFAALFSVTFLPFICIADPSSYVMENRTGEVFCSLPLLYMTFLIGGFSYALCAVFKIHTATDPYR